MKLFDSIGPNPRLVRMFLAEKGVKVDIEKVDLMAGENRQSAHLARNPHGQMPALELDDGSYLSEILAICEYIEDIHPAPAMIGATPKERAECRMWTRRIDLNICEPMAMGFRFAEGLKLFEKRIICLPEAAPGLKRIAADRLRWLDGQMNGNEFICGSRFTLADMMLYAWLDFGRGFNQPLAPENTNLIAWFERVKERPSTKA